MSPWRFPEVWVDVPDERSLSTGASRPSELTIYLLEDGRYRTAPASVAFPGWTAAEIHMAMNEKDCSAATVEGLTRVGRVLGERLGTGPDDDPLLGVQRRRAGREGARKVFEVMQLLGARGIAYSQALMDAREVIVEAPLPVLQRAAFDCADTDDFLRRLRALT